MGGHGLAACGSEVLRAAVQHTASLEQLVVKFAISNSGVAHLAPSLRTNQVLACLRLSAAAIGDAGAAALALSLPHNAGLRELDLSRVRATIHSLLAVLQACRPLPTLCLMPGKRLSHLSCTAWHMAHVQLVLSQQDTHGQARGCQPAQG